MPPQTRLTTVKENRSLRSKKVRFVETVRISLTRCDNTNNPSRSNNKSPKKTIVKSVGKASKSKSTNSPKSNQKQKQHLSPAKRKPTKLEEKSPEKKPVAIKNDIRKPDSKTNSPKIVTKDKPPKKPATVLENVKQSPIKITTTNKDTSKSELRIKKPLFKKALTKESRLRKQMKLGRIFIKPTFPIQSVLKRQIHSGDKEENQGQFVTDSTPELNNNTVVKRIQPKIVLRKIDQRAEKPIRNTRKILRHL